MVRPYRDMEERLVANSAVDHTTGCWIWLGHIDGGGYGRLSVRVKGKRSPESHFAHRVSVQVLKGEAIPEGYHVDHICETRCCINPNHLQVIPAHENLSYRNGRRR